MILALDTSTRNVGLALFDGSQVLSEIVWVSQDYHTIELAPAIAQMLERSGVRVSDLEALAVATGPGSFTGLRIGLALAKGLALARRLPVAGIPTLDILAAAQPVLEIPLAAVLRVGRGRLAVGWYRPGDGAYRSTENMQILTAQDLSTRITRPTLVSGELTEEERMLLGRKRVNVVLASPARSLRRPSYLAELGWERLQSGQSDDPASLSPFYLHTHESLPG